MALEQDLDEFEKMLGFEPQRMVKHPNENMNYPSSMKDKAVVFKEWLKDNWQRLILLTGLSILIFTLLKMNVGFKLGILFLFIYMTLRGERKK